MWNSLVKWAAFNPTSLDFVAIHKDDYFPDDFGIDDETSATVGDQDGEPLIMLDLSREVEYGELLEFDSDEFDLDEVFDYGEPLVAQALLVGGGTGTETCYDNNYCPGSFRT
eukprot:CAMPEP_0197490412 /NCGR_PEP_ID=MMETSP1311-20131121/4966_1 /TAXON_ID=464262 /ORGANISM="Genus nov. species nov., Strain RCC856" /LENGTH=111 /DNA_ID=CAMNT_0043034925 /DNA_START=342 /DNA_END=677 /DNA_ORIENTATION=-